MASWKKLSITAKGAELFARALSERLTFTAIAAGDGLNMSGERESLVNELMRVTPSSVTRDGRIVSVHAAFGPEFNARKITLSEVGVYAKIGEEAEVLVAYGHSTGQGDIIDATASNTNVEKIFNFKFVFSNEANVVLRIPPEAYATNKSVRDTFVDTFGTEDFDKNDTLKIENRDLDVTGNEVDIKTSYFKVRRKSDGDSGISGEELFTVTGTTGSDPETCEIKTDETNIASEEVTITAVTEEGGGGRIALDTDTLEIDATKTTWTGGIAEIMSDSFKFGRQLQTNAYSMEMTQDRGTTFNGSFTVRSLTQYAGHVPIGGSADVLKIYPYGTGQGNRVDVFGDFFADRMRNYPLMLGVSGDGVSVNHDAYSARVVRLDEPGGSGMAPSTTFFIYLKLSDSLPEARRKTLNLNNIYGKRLGIAFGDMPHTLFFDSWFDNSSDPRVSPEKGERLVTVLNGLNTNAKFTIALF